MDIRGRNALVFGGAGLVGAAVCRELLAHQPARLVVAARRESRARQTAAELTAEHGALGTRILPVWGDVFARGDWPRDSRGGRERLLADRAKRRRMVADVLDPLNEEIIRSSLLAQMIEGTAPGCEGTPAEIVVDCLNTATVIGYQDIYRLGQGLADHAGADRAGAECAATDCAATDWPEAAERLLASLYLPQLVRHIQLLYAAMRRAETEAYVKVGTSGTGGMGFDIPYTHGEEKPSRLLLSKAALAGAQTMLTFLMARTAAAPRIVKEVKPSALIGWREIGYGPIRRGGQDISVYDCPPEHAVSIDRAQNLVAVGDFGEPVAERLEGVYIDTGENGLFSTGEFVAITALGQMELVTPEEIARNVVAEITGANTGHDVVAALDGAVMGPTFRGGYLRQAAIDRLNALEREHGRSVAFEMLGPPRLSKLLFEAYLLQQSFGTADEILARAPEDLADALEAAICENPAIRQRIISIGLPILLADGKRLLRGPLVKSREAENGWVDLTSVNMETWRKRFEAFRANLGGGGGGGGADSSSRGDWRYGATGQGQWTGNRFDIGELAAWILTVEDGGRRAKR